MNQLRNSLAAAAMLAAGPALAEQTEISPNGSRKTVQGPAEYFTGAAYVNPLFGANEQLPASVADVTFVPGARTAWHSHPAGQVMMINDGTGWVQEEGGEKRVVRPGDVVWTPPGVKHWHGATATTSMTHTVISIMKDGENVVWLDKVTDAEYGD